VDSAYKRALPAPNQTHAQFSIERTVRSHRVSPARRNVLALGVGNETINLVVVSDGCGWADRSQSVCAAASPVHAILRKFVG
jgi:hypothetical protein